MLENSILIGLSRQITLARELDVVANNVANVNTNGFKARTSRFEEYISPKARAETFPAGDRRLSYVVDKGTPLDATQGAVEHTGNPLDLAIKGDAFFAVQTPNGERYTRNGSFQINAQGQLVTTDGNAVLGTNGPLTFAPTEYNPEIGPDGTITTSQGQRGRVRLVRFANIQGLRNEGSNVFSSTTPPQAAGDTAQVESGAIERSNVNSVLEMSHLIEVNRSYASVTNMIQETTTLRQTALRRLADVQA